MSLGTCAEKVAGPTNGFKPDMMFSRFGLRAFKQVSEQRRGRLVPIRDAVRLTKRGDEAVAASFLNSTLASKPHR